MNNTPQWQLNLLARFPRPAAVAIIVITNWLLDEGFMWISFISWFLVMPVLVGLIRQSWIDAIIVGAVNFGATLAALAVAFWFYDQYTAMSKKLPQREKKPDDETKETA